MGHLRRVREFSKSVVYVIETDITHLSPFFKVLPLPALPATRKVIPVDRRS